MTIMSQGLFTRATLLLGAFLIAVSIPIELTAQVAPVQFKRGDCNRDAVGDISDPITILDSLFLGGETPGCLEACNANDDSALDLSDAVFLLDYLFIGGTPIPAPGILTCGVDGGDSLGCQAYEPCGPLPSMFVSPPAFVALDGKSAFCAVNPPVDLNGDGKPDTAVTYRDTGDMAVLLGDGQGGFASSPRLPLSTTADYTPEAIAAGTAASGSGIKAVDLDGDADFDLVAVDAGQRPRQGKPALDVPGYVLIYKNDGGAISRLSAQVSGRWSIEAVAGDFKEDGKPDLVTFNRGDQGSYQVFLGDGQLGLEAQPEVFFDDCPDPHFSDAVGDFDHDGHLDFLVPCTDPQDNPPPVPGGKVLALFGNGDGKFRDPVKIEGFDMKSPHDVTAADWNLDGNPDFATSNIGAGAAEGRISVFFGDGRGGFANRIGSPYAVSSPGTTSPFIVAADFGGIRDGLPDGLPDILVVDRAGGSTPNSFTVLFNYLPDVSSSTFRERPELTLPLTIGNGLNVQQPVVGDLDGDGLPDVAAVHFGAGAQPGGLVVLRHSGK
jgi:VCBS repeat protein